MSPPSSWGLASSWRRISPHPGALLTLVAFRLASAALIVSPVASLLHVALAGYRTGDALLFEPGGELLVETLRIHGPELVAAVGVAARIAVAMSFIGLVPQAMLLEAWRSRRRLPWPTLVARGLRQWSRFSSLAGLTLLVQAVVLGLGAALFSVARSLGAPLGELGADVVGLVPLAVAVLAALAAGIGNDLAQIGLVATRGRVRAALRLAEATALRSPWRLLLAWGVPRVLALLLVALSATVTSVFALHRPEAWRLGVLALVHAGVIAGTVVSRALWLAAATDLAGPRVTPSQPPPADTAAGSVVPDDPSWTPAA